MKIADEIRDQLGVLWEKAHSGGLREHRKVKDVKYALSQILTLIDKENEDECEGWDGRACSKEE